MALTKITTSVIAANTLGTANIADNSIDATKIAANSILTRHIDDDQITGDQLADDITIAGNLTVTGNLVTNGASVTNSSTNTTIEDNLIELGTGTSGAPSSDSGIVIERGDSDNAFIGWDESEDKFILGTGSFTGASTGNLTITTAPLVVGALTTSGLSFPTSDGTNGQVLKTDGSGSLTFGDNTTKVDNYTATGDGENADFDTGINPGSVVNTWIFIDGVYQQKSEYSYSGSTVTFTTAPQNGASIDVITGTSSNITASDTVLGVYETTTTNTDTYTTGISASNENNTWVFVGGVYQPKDSYTFSSGTLTFDANTPTGQKLSVVATKTITAGAVDTSTLAANAVTSAKIASNSILSRHISNNSIVGADISATTQITASTFTGALTGDVTGNVVGNLTGTIQTAAQTNITSVGTLSGFTSTGIDDNATSTAITIDSSENVGIGASSVQSWAKLQVAGTAGAQTGAKQALYIQSPTATANEGVGIRMSAASGSHEAVGIIGMVNNASGNAGSMTFHTYNLGATIPEVMRITNTGNVGIGTDSPVGKTHIKNNNTYATSSQTSYDNASLRLDNLNTSSSIGTSFVIISPNVNYLQSGYNEGTTAPFALNPYGGNVGIGTSSPATTLDVVAGSTGGIRLKPTGQITNGYTGGLADFRQGLTFENAASSHAFSIGYGQGGHLRVSFHDGSSTFTELVEFKYSGTLNLSAGNLEIQPGYGIDFSGNANASGMSSELLDDYEEGTFTATIGSN